MKAFLIVSCLLAVALASSVDEEWNRWKAQYNKSYPVEEEQVRKRIFEHNRNKIQEHNRQYEQGKKTFHLAVNKFADLQVAEFSAKFKGLSGRRVVAKAFAPVFTFNESAPLPDTFDWRTKGVVTPVKNQLQCGSCWAFSATGSLEGQHALKTGKLVSLSEQNLVDCDKLDDGCGGGLMDQAFTWIKKNGGIDTEASYPYVGVDQKCKYNKLNVGARDTGYTDVKHGDEAALRAAVATVGPISIGIDASASSFQFYSGGVYVENECSSEYLDHGVLAVGYGTAKKGGDYWLVKNSWGEDWGAKGYILMARNKNNQCGVSTQASYPLV